MSLAVLADHLASKGRNGDTMLVHMTPEEVHGLHALALAHGGQLTINPETGLPEANFLKKMLPMIAGMALNFIAPGVGTAIGSMLGVSGAVGTGIAIGGLTGLATGSLKQGIMAGLGAYGGASLAGGLMSASGAQGAAGALGVPGAATSAGSQAAMLAEQTAGFGAEGLQKLAESAAYAKGAAPSLAPSFMAGVKGLGTEAGRSAFMQGVGGTSGLMRAGLTAAAGADAFGQPQTATPMPGGGFQYTPRIRPMSWNQYTGQLEQLPMFSAINKAGLTPAPAPAKTEEQPPGGYNTGGIVALAGGGDTQQFATAGTYLPNYLGLNAVAAGQPEAVISKNALSGYDYAAATPQNEREKQINQIYNQVLGRQAEQEGLKYWAGTSLSVPEIQQKIQGIAQDIGVKVDPTQLATPTAAQLAAQQSILADPQAAALAAARSGIAAGMTDQQIADMVNMQYGKSFSAQNVADFMKAQGLTRPTTTSTATSVTYGGDTVTPEYVAPQPQVTLGTAFQPTAQTMNEVKTAYEQGGGSTTMPTITDIKPTDRTYTQNEAVSLLRGYLQTNPNALYSDVQKFAASRGIPEMQARAAYNEFRFDTMTGGTKAAYDYLMGRAPYSTKPFVPGGGPIMRPYAEAVGLAAPGSTGGGYFGRKTIPTSPTDKTAQSTTGGGSTTSSAVTGGGTTTTGGGTTLLNKSNTTASNTGTGVDTTRSTDASTVGGVVVGNNVIDPISGRVLGVVTANVDQGTGGIIQGDVIVDPISGKIIGYTGDAGLIAQLVNKKIGEEPAIIESREIGGGDAGYDYDVGAGYYDDAANRDRSFYYDYAAPSRSFDDMGFGSVYYGNTAFTPQERAALLGLRGGGLADVAAMSAARGGNVQGYNLGGYSDGGRLLRGPGDGVSDSIPATIGNKQPARLADGEFVIPARIVSEIGNGSTEAGARKLYAMMDRVQRARAKTTGKGKVAKNTRAEKYLPA